MTRRNLIRKISTLCLISGIFSIEKITRFFEPAILNVKVIFPPNKTLSDYSKDRSQWVQGHIVDNKIKELHQKRELLSWKDSWNESEKILTIRYEFRSREIAQHYVDFVKNSVGINREIRTSLGYAIKHNVV